MLEPTRTLSNKDIGALAEKAVTIIAGTRHPDVVFLCEHGGRRVPAPWKDLGLPKVLFETHFGCDIGAGELTRAVAQEIGATAIIANYSRLFLDYNRKRSDPECWRIEMGGIPIPGNLALTAAQIEVREMIARAPVERATAHATEQVRARAIISVHSFSPYWNNAKRDCEIGVMWRGDGSLAQRLIEQLSKQGEYVVRDNEPYDFRGSDWFTLQRHGLDVGVPCAYVEVRNDLVSTSVERQRISKVVGEAVLLSCTDSTLHQRPTAKP
jgi:predicted N-formylglutamate amidohydrolase